MSSKSATDVLVEAISSAAKSAVANAQFDVSSYGIVTNRSGYTYKIAAFGGEYTVTTNRDYDIGQKLVVTAMQKNFRNVILAEGNQSLEAAKVRTITSDLSDLTNNVDKIDNNLNNLINQTETTNKNTQDQIGGVIHTNYGYGVPTKENEPAATWVKRGTERFHVNELYYDTNTGKCYRWIEVVNGDSKKEYQWYEIVDSSIINALAAASLAQNTADSKCQVFRSVPTAPYNVGDLWFLGSDSDLYICTSAQGPTGSYSSGDWEKATKYTDDTTANTVNERVASLETKESNDYTELKKSLGTTNTGLDSFKKNDFVALQNRVGTNETNIKSLTTKEANDYSALDKKIDGVATDLSTFETGDYATTKAQVATNKNNITNLTTNLNGLSKTEKTHYDSLTKKVNAITADSILSTLRMKINSEGALCYVATSI